MQRTLYGLTILLLLGLFHNLGPARVCGDVLVCDDFDQYDPGSLANRNGGAGWDGPWISLDGAATIAVFDDASAHAAFSGDAVSLGGNTRMVRKLNVHADGPLARAGLVENGLVGRKGATLYVGFLQRITVVPTANPSDPARHAARRPDSLYPLGIP